jgi:hypothetical protein
MSISSLIEGVWPEQRVSSFINFKLASEHEDGTDLPPIGVPKTRWTINDDTVILKPFGR